MSLKVGDKAPDFTLPTDGGGKVSLKALKGKKVVLYFYPKDDTPGCTAEACAFRDSLPDFSKIRATVVGVSKDSVASHDKFKTKFKLPSRSLPTTTVRSARPTARGWKKACSGRSTWASSAQPSSSTRRASSATSGAR